MANGFYEEVDLPVQPANVISVKVPAHHDDGQVQTACPQYLDGGVSLDVNRVLDASRIFLDGDAIATEAIEAEEGPDGLG